MSPHKFKSDSKSSHPFQNNLLTVAIGLCLYGGVHTPAEAALPSGTILTITLGDGTCAAGGTWPNCNYGANVVTTGSFFTMDGNFGAVVESDAGIVLDSSQPYDGNAISSVNAYDGSGTNIVKPWLFFSNTGTNFSDPPGITVVSDTEIDMSGWRVGWGEVPNINMGSGSNAVMACSGGSCDDGDTYILDYSATVPPGDPSGFGGVLYALHLEGTVIFPGAVPTASDDLASTITANPVAINVQANDEPKTGADAIITNSTTVTSTPSNGSADATSPDGRVVYTPNTGPDFNGTDTFQYTVSNANGSSNAATVTVNVQANVAPVAIDDAISVRTQELDNSSQTVAVLANDSDANNSTGLVGGIDPATVTIVSQPATGTCTVNANGTITYSQTAPSIAGTFTCTYKVADIDAINTPLESNIAALNVTVTTEQSDWPAALDPDIIPILFFDAGIPGDPVDSSIPPKSGSYFTMQVTPTTLIYTVMKPASSGGLIIGHDQPGGNSHTGAPTGNEKTAIDLAWTFFSNTGFAFTKNGGITGNPDGTLQFGSKSGGQGKYIITWNGIPEIDLGGDTTGQFPNDLGFGFIRCTPAPCADQSSFNLEYAAHVPPGDPSGFGGVPYTLHLEGTVGFLDKKLKASNGTLASSTRTVAGDIIASDPDDGVELQCVGDCFDYTIENLIGNKTSIVIPLAGGVPINPVWRILDTGTWRSFDTTVDTIKSAPFKAGDVVCPDPGNATYTAPPTRGHRCIELTIEDNGPNDLDPAVGTISDPSGMGAGGSAGGGSGFVDTRTSSTSGCTLVANSVTPQQRSDWWLLAGFIATLYSRRRLRTYSGIGK